MPRSRWLLGLAMFGLVSASGAGAAMPALAATGGPSLSVDVTAGRHAISPGVYGINRPDSALASAIGLPVDRWGGNTTSRYNWQNNTWNTGSDYYFENIVGSSTDSVDAFVSGNKARSATSIVTVPMIGYVAKDSPSAHPFACGYPRSRFPSQDSFDFWDSNCGNGQAGGVNVTGAVPSDTSIAAGASFAGGMVSHLVGSFGTAANGGVGIYELDNEPVLWNSTHRDVHPAALTYDELATKSTATAAAIKAADPSAATLGPSDWGWCAYYYSAADNCSPGADRSAHGNVDLAPWYLQRMKAYADAHGGVRTLDYFDEHYYPQASGVALSPAGTVTTQALRLRSTRSLWDPTYVDESWIGTGGVGAPPIQLIRTMKSWVNANYPGTRTAMTEYNWGALDSMNGALAQADVLGIFGREGLDLATLWSGPTATQPGAFAFRAFRNYDGAGARFGDVSVAAVSSDQSQLAAYAGQRTADGAVTVVVVNKSAADLVSPLTVANFVGNGVAQQFSYSAANLGAFVRGSDLAVTSGALTATYPANSLTVLVFPAGSGGPSPTAPSAPSGVSASAGNASAVVSWAAGPDGGSAITSYSVVASPGGAAVTTSATSATVSGLTNGTAYTFTVAAANAVGTSPPSAASAAVTPRAPVSATSLTLAASRTRVRAGTAVALSGVLSSGAARVGSATVHLQRRAHGSTSAWLAVSNAATSSLGAVSYVVAPTSWTDYRLVYDGSAAYGPSKSPTVAVGTF